MSDCIDRFTLTQWVFNDLRPDQMALVEAHVDGCASCAADAEAIRETACPEAGSGEAHFPGVSARFATLRHRTRSGRVQGYWLPVGVAVAVAVLVTIAGSIFLKEKRPPTSPAADPVRQSAVGDLACNAYVKRGDEQRPVEINEALDTGDKLRFVLFSDGPGFVTVFSVDQGGTLFPLYPSSPPDEDPEPLAIDGGGSFALPGARSLGATSGEVTVTVMLTPGPFDRRAVHALLRPLAKNRRFDEMQRVVQKMSGQMRVYQFSKVARVP